MNTAVIIYLLLLLSGAVCLSVGIYILLGLGWMLIVLAVVLFSFVGHSVDALVPRADEGRCGLRNASGSWRASVDPRVSEWGNLAGVVPGHHCLNS